MSRAAPRPDPDSLKAHLAYELRRLRAKAELSQQQLADALGCTPQWIWQLENCEKTVSAQTARDLDVYFETEGRETDDGLFHRLYRSIKKAELSRVLLPGFDSYLEFEQRANILCGFSAQVVPGILQIEEYARGTMSPDELPDTLEARVSSRMERQTILRREDPPKMMFVLDESVLNRPIGGGSVMAKQLEYLMGLAELPRVQVHVLPFAPPVPAALDGGFTLLSFTGEQDLMYVEAATIGQLTERADLVADGRVRFNSLMGEALSQAESVMMMMRKREEYL